MRKYRRNSEISLSFVVQLICVWNMNEERIYLCLYSETGSAAVKDILLDSTYPKF
jgi:hypothetical protein